VSAEEHIQRLERSVNQLIQEIERLPADVLYRPPSEGEWPVMSTLAHLAELLPYVLSRSCSDPRDRTLEREELAHLRVLEGGADLPRVGRMRRQAAHEPIPTRPSRLAALLAVLIVLCLLSQMLGMLFVHWR